MEILKSFLKQKQAQDQSKAPKYGMRKLSVGFVSCILGCAVLMAPMGVHAESEAAPAPVAAVETQAKPVEVKSVEATEASVAEASSAEASVAEASSAEADTTVEENAAFETQDTTVETKAESEVAPAAVEDQVETAEAEAPKQEAAAEKKAVDTKDEEKSAEVETEDSADKDSKDQTSEEKPQAVEAKSSEAEAGDQTQVDDAKAEIKAFAEVLGRSNEVDPEAQTAEKSKDISNDIINPRVSIRTQNTTTPGTLDAGLGEQLTWGVSFTTPEGTKEGDTFTVKLSDNMSLKGLEPDTDYALPVKFGDKTIATAKRIDRQTIQYTFTKEINDLKYARVYIINSAQENREKVQETSDQTFKINVGEKAADEQNIKVDFGKIYEAALSGDVNGKSQFTEFNPEDGSFTQVFYLNPESKEISISSTSDQNGREYGKVGFLLSSPHDADKPRSVDYLENNTKIEVKKLPKGAKLPDAIIENPEGAQKATNVEGEFRKFKGEPMFTMNFGNGNKIDSPYVVVVKGHANKIDGKYTNLYSNGTLYGDGEASLFLDNEYTVQENNTDSEGVKETLGYFKEHHIYITKKDGTEKSRFEIPGATVSGTADQYYYTDKNEISGYHFVKVDTDKLVNDPAYNEKGEITKGNYEVGKTKEVTYIYERDIKHGSFQEHHIYQSIDEDGNVVAEETVKWNSDETTGFDETSYDTSKKDKNKNQVTSEEDSYGYKLVKVEASGNSAKKDEVKFNSEGAATTGNYVNGEKLEVTYTYQKKVITKGKFQEHHIYITKDEDGKEVSREVVDGTETSGKKEDPYTTSAKEKDGFKFVKTQDPKENPSYDSKGAEKTGNYVAGKKQEVTYVYEKTVKKPVPPTPDKPKKPGEPSKPVNPTPKTPDEPTGWIPVKPVDPKTPENPVKDEPKNPVPETPVKEEPKNPAPQTPEKPVQPKPVDQKVEKPVEPKAEEKETLTTDAPVTTKKEVGQPKVYKSDDSEGKAPQTFDAGVASYASLAGLASGALAYLESKKRKNK